MYKHFQNQYFFIVDINTIVINIQNIIDIPGNKNTLADVLSRLANMCDKETEHNSDYTTKTISKKCYSNELTNRQLTIF